LFPITRTSEESEILGISANICIKFSLGKHVLEQKDNTRVSMTTLGK
jgi:hypothetical protein